MQAACLLGFIAGDSSAKFVYVSGRKTGFELACVVVKTEIFSTADSYDTAAGRQGGQEDSEFLPLPPP